MLLHCPLTSVGIHDARIEIHELNVSQSYHREGLVDLPEGNVLLLQLTLFQDLAHGGHGGCGEVDWGQRCITKPWGAGAGQGREGEETARVLR